MESIQAPFTIVTIVWVVIILLGYDTNTPGLSDPVLEDRYLMSAAGIQGPKTIGLGPEPTKF